MRRVRQVLAIERAYRLLLVHRGLLVELGVQLVDQKSIFHLQVREGSHVVRVFDPNTLGLVLPELKVLVRDAELLQVVPIIFLAGF